METAVRPFSVEHAEDLARTLLPPTEERWQHSAGVADRARLFAQTVAMADRDLLIAAAWLHDIGYAPALHETGFHPLDGARHLARLGWPKRLTSLVAHHSGSRFVAEVRGLGPALRAFPAEISPLSDALTYADQTIGPHGRPFTVEQRMAEMLRRHGPDSPQAEAQRARGPYLLAVASRVRRRLLTRAA
jgi:putative nucleotidyltransferase with HDIG domain